jgi:response regulator RpfG family c-di-GMP phosphodiesterase
MRKYNVMMVDDDSFTNELASMVIRWTPYSDYFQVKEHADEALELLKKKYSADSDDFPDYILLDLKMPQIHGFDFIKEFEAIFPGKKDKTFFIVTTSSILKRDRNKALSFDSVIDYIVKPIPGDYIENLIKNGYQKKENFINNLNY